MVAALDDSIGDVVRSLNHHDMLNNTIIVFTTDNGGPANGYDGNAACNYPLRYIPCISIFVLVSFIFFY